MHTDDERMQTCDLKCKWWICFSCLQTYNIFTELLEFMQIDNQVEME